MSSHNWPSDIRLCCSLSKTSVLLAVYLSDDDNGNFPVAFDVSVDVSVKKTVGKNLFATTSCND